jgi:hypothetical protein
MTLIEFAASLITGGAAGSAITAWVGWDIQKRKHQLLQRQQSIDCWLGLIATLPDQGGWSGGGGEERKFLIVGRSYSRRNGDRGPYSSGRDKDRVRVCG